MSFWTSFIDELKQQDKIAETINVIKTSEERRIERRNEELAELQEKIKRIEDLKFIGAKHIQEYKNYTSRAQKLIEEKEYEEYFDNNKEAFEELSKKLKQHFIYDKRTDYLVLEEDKTLEKWYVCEDYKIPYSYITKFLSNYGYAIYIGDKIIEITTENNIW